MKITILGPAHPFRGGIAAMNERLSDQLKKEGHQVNIVSFTVQYPEFLFPGTTQFSNNKVILNFPVTREVNTINPFNWVKTGKKIQNDRPDLLIVRFWMPFFGMSFGTICKRVRKNRHTKIIALVDNVIPHEKRLGDKIFTNYFIKNADAFITMSTSVLNDLNAFDTNKPRKYTPHPVYDHYGRIEEREKALLKLKLDSKSRYILFFGFIREYKGLDLLLKAVSDKYFSHNNIKLIIAGEFYEDETKYLNLIRDLKLTRQVILRTDYIPDEEVKDYFNAADIVAQPYKSATQSGVTQIGYHFNKPMLVTNVGGLPEVIPHLKAGYVVSPEIMEIRNALIDFFRNNRKDFFIQNVIQEKERFKWDKMTETIYKLYNELK